jgi:hypothetical protein
MAVAAVAAESEELECVIEGLEAVQIMIRQVQVVHRAMGQGHGLAAVHAGEMVLVPLGGGEQGLAAG